MDLALPFGITELIPFFFVLAVTYGALEVSKTFHSKGVKGLISVVMALFAITMPGLSAFIMQILPYAAAIFIIFFFLGFMMSFFREGEKGGKKDLTLPVIIAGLIIVLIASQGEALGRLAPELGFLGSGSFMTVVVIVVVLLALFATYKKFQS